MPLPTPNDGESQNDFIQRCVANPTMKNDYPDMKQRLAVCYAQEKKRDAPTDDAEQQALLVELFGERGGLERRPFGWERRASLAGTKSHPLIRGTAIVFNTRSQDLGGFTEVIRPEAF